MSSHNIAEFDAAKPLPNRPEAKLPPLPKGFTPLSRPFLLRNVERRELLSSLPQLPALPEHLNLISPLASEQSQPREHKSFPKRRSAHLTGIGRVSGSRIHKRPLPRPSPLRNELKRIEDSSREPATAGLDGWIPPPRATYTKIIRVTSTASFAGLLRRVRDALENGQEKTKGLPLTARVAAMGMERDTRNQGRQTSGAIEDRYDDVVLIGAGRAIQKTMEVGAVFTRRKDLCIVPRTSTITGIDDIINVDEDADVEDSSRLRYISCLEIGIRWVG